MTKLLALAVLMASPQTTGKPRLELTLGPGPKGGAPGFTVLVTLVNDSSQPVEAAAPMMIVPKVIGPDGKPVVFVDWRNMAGFAPPRVPGPPTEPVRPGTRAEVARYHVVELEHGHELSVPYGGAALAPGGHAISVSWTFAPVTREAWASAYVLGARMSPGSMKRGETPAQAAARAAAVHAKHWAEVPTFWTGTLESNVLEFTVPAKP